MLERFAPPARYSDLVIYVYAKGTNLCVKDKQDAICHRSAPEIVHGKRMSELCVKGSEIVWKI